MSGSKPGQSFEPFYPSAIKKGLWGVVHQADSQAGGQVCGCVGIQVDWQYGCLGGRASLKHKFVNVIP